MKKKKVLKKRKKWYKKVLNPGHLLTTKRSMQCTINVSVKMLYKIALYMRIHGIVNRNYCINTILNALK